MMAGAAGVLLIFRPAKLAGLRPRFQAAAESAPLQAAAALQPAAESASLQAAALPAQE
jgi:hypothetical protein